MSDSNSSESIDLARRVLETEAQAIQGLIARLDASFDRALDLPRPAPAAPS